MMVDEPHQRPPFLVEFWQEKSQRFECLTQPWLHHYENTAKPTRRKGGSTSFQGFFSFSPQRTFKVIWSVGFLIMTSTKVLISMSLFLMCLMHSERKKNKTNKAAAYGEFADCEAACGSFHGQKWMNIRKHETCVESVKIEMALFIG